MFGKIKYKELNHMHPCLMTEFQMAFQKFKRYKPLGIDQIPAEMFRAGSIKVHCEVHEPVISIRIRKNYPISARSETFYLLIRRR